MAWLRIDDAFVRHPKITPLSDRQFRTWMRVLCWCSEYDNGGTFAAEQIAGEVVGADNRFLEVCRENGLLDLTDDGLLQVHDWGVYNSRVLTPTERQRAWRGRQKRDGDVDADVDADVTRPRGRAGTRPRSPLGERESDRATLSLSKDASVTHEGGDDAATSSGSAASSPPSPVLTGRPAEPRSATNLDTGTIAAGTLDWCLGDCGRQYDLDELGAEGICTSCRAKQKEES